PEAVFRQRFVVEAGPDGLFRHHDNRLLDALIFKLIQCHEHQRATLARCRRRFDQKILLAAFFKGAFLHRSHTQSIGLGRDAIAGIADGNGGNSALFDGVIEGHDSSSGLAVSASPISSCSICSMLGKSVASSGGRDSISLYSATPSG